MAGTGTDNAPEAGTEPGKLTSIEDIQGTGEASPMSKKSVTTSGWVTASYPTGGLRGFVIQMGGTGELRESREKPLRLSSFTPVAKLRVNWTSVSLSRALFLSTRLQHRSARRR